MISTRYYSLTAAALLAAGIIAAPSSALPCSIAQCGDGLVTPYAGPVPANMPAFVWHPATHVNDSQLSPTPEASHIELVELDGSTETSVPVQIAKVDFGWLPAWEILPQQELSENANYELRTQAYCSQEEGLSATFSTGARADLPTSLGKLVADAGFVDSLRIHTSACESTVDAYQVPIRVDLSAEAEPWKNVLMWETFVDGKSWIPGHSAAEFEPPGESWEGRGVDLITSTCDDDWDSQGLDPGTYTVEMKATIPGTNVELSTDPIDVTIDCGWAQQAEPIEPSAPDAGPRPDAAGTDAGGDAGTDANEGGCSVSDGHAPSGTWLIALGGLGLFLARRRGGANLAD